MLSSRRMKLKHSCNRVVDCKPQIWAQNGTLKLELDQIDPLIYPLLRWLLASNRSHLRKLERSEMIEVCIIL